MKLVGNAMIISMTGALADALTVAEASGVAPADAMRLFETFQVSNTITGRGARMVQGDYRASFELAMAHKDVRLILAEAARAGVQRLAEAAHDLAILLAARAAVGVGKGRIHG